LHARRSLRYRISSGVIQRVASSIEFGPKAPKRLFTVGVTFSFYAQQSGDSPLWMETQNVELDAKGVYAVLLGANTAAGLPEEMFRGGEARWLGIQPEREPELPRVLLVSAPYASKAADADTLGGLPASAFVLAVVPGLASDIFALIKATGFPQRAKAQINHLAESLAGRPTVSLRTPRDICGKMRAEESTKSPYKIIRKEFYVVCECGYKGPAEFDACRKCGAQISYLPGILFGSKIF
jgi:hypothetical protein